MPKQKTDDLIDLIRSLTRAEKRHFRLFVRRNQASDDILFLQLFDFLDKHQDYDEALILRKLPGVKKRQLSNLKAHLYKQLLISLRMLSRNHNQDVEIREMIDYARVLYNKGLYRQALDMLDKTKERALEHRFYALALEVLEFEKHIEGQYITRSIEGRAEELTEQTLRLNEIFTRSNQFSNLALQLYGRYLRLGYVRNREDYLRAREFFHQNLPPIQFQELDFTGKVYYCQAHVWYYYMAQEFPLTYRYAQKWVNLFRENPKMIEVNTPLYLKGLHNLLNALFNVLHYDKFNEALEELKQFPRKVNITQVQNIEGLYYLYYYIHSIKQHFMQGTFSEGLELVPELMRIIESDRYNWDDHRIMVFYYRIACLYFGNGDNNNAIHYLNLITNQKNPDYRGDIQCFARILSLIAHYELGNQQLLEYQVKSVYRFLAKMEDLQAVQREIFRFLRRMPRIRTEDLPAEFSALREKLLKLEEDPFEKRPFLYLDIISWLECKIENRPVQEIIREKYRKRRAAIRRE